MTVARYALVYAAVWTNRGARRGAVETNSPNIIDRYLVKEGAAKIEQYRDGKRKDVKVHMFLFNDCLLLTKPKKRPERESWVCAALDGYESELYRLLVTLFSCTPYGLHALAFEQSHSHSPSVTQG